ncbi:hypothetical protein R1flu_019689 [Riccia fluitans]|uniref:Uncharacterized protein n=1 Tax=Riccia fluitans TaxID=41844 RepID=A0ABD1ZLJ4_9MARC
MLTKWRYKNGDYNKQIGYMKLDGKNEEFIKSIECDHEQYIGLLIEAGKTQGLSQPYITMMVVAFNRHLNKFNDLELVPTEYLWEYHTLPLTVQIKDEKLSDGEQDARKNAKFDLAKKKEEVNMVARDKGTSSNAIRANLQWSLYIFGLENLVGNRNSQIPKFM